MTTDEGLERMEKSIGDLAGDVKNLTRYVLELRTESANLTRYVLELRDETTNRLEIIENRLEVLAATFSTLDSRLVPLTKAILEFNVVATRPQREQTRVARLVEPAA